MEHTAIYFLTDSIFICRKIPLYETGGKLKYNMSPYIVMVVVLDTYVIWQDC